MKGLLRRWDWPKEGERDPIEGLSRFFVIFRFFRLNPLPAISGFSFQFSILGKLQPLERGLRKDTTGGSGLAERNEKGRKILPRKRLRSFPNQCRCLAGRMGKPPSSLPTLNAVDQ